MNLWVKRVGQLLVVLAVALFFYGCEDETSLLGYKNPNSKFNVRYVEIPLESSVLLLDSIRTSNYFFTQETNRLLVGQYQDEAFGTVTSNMYSQYFGGVAVPAGAIYDSVSLELAFDFYTYGSSEITAQNISVYEITEELSLSGSQYVNKSELQTSPTELGNKSFSIDPQSFKKYLDANKDTTLTVVIRLSNDLGTRLFASAERARDKATTKDSVFITYNEFVKEFKGLAVKVNSGDKIIGIDPTRARSRVILHYQTATTDSLQLSLRLAGAKGFSQITADRSGTNLASLVRYDPLQLDKGYIQSGTGIVTKLNLEKFLAFADTVPNILINSAELIIGDVEESPLSPPTNLALRALKNNNRQKAFSRLNSQDVTDRLLYKAYLDIDVDAGAQQRTVSVDHDSVFFVRNDQGGGNILSYSSEKKQYSGFMSTFLQQLSRNDGKTRYVNFAVFPLAPSAAKSVNRVVFNKDAIKLKIYYTKPTVTTNQ